MLAKMRLIVIALCLVTLVSCELDWWQKTVFYQIYPRSFKDSDNNGIGDLKGRLTLKFTFLCD